MQPEQPSSNPFKSFASDPGNIRKLESFKFSNKLYEESLQPIILSGKFLTSLVTASAENLYPLNFSKLYKITFILGAAHISFL